MASVDQIPAGVCLLPRNTHRRSVSHSIGIWWCGILLWRRSADFLSWKDASWQAYGGDPHGNNASTSGDNIGVSRVFEGDLYDRGVPNAVRARNNACADIGQP